MHVLAVPLFLDATGVVIALTAWARHRCLQLYFTLCLLFVTDSKRICTCLGLSKPALNRNSFSILKDIEQIFTTGNLNTSNWPLDSTDMPVISYNTQHYKITL